MEVFCKSLAARKSADFQSKVREFGTPQLSQRRLFAWPRPSKRSHIGALRKWMSRQVSPELLSRLRWRILPLLCAGYSIDYVHRANLAWAALQMRDALNLSQQTFGLASGLFFVSYSIMQVPSNAILFRLGAANVLGGAVLAWSCISAATGFATGAGMLCALRLFLGLFEACYAPGMTLYVYRAFPPSAR